MPQSDLYERDFYAWANEQAALLRSGQIMAADVENIAEEIESIGRAEKRELVRRLAALLLHLLKWQFQPEKRGTSWQATIKIQRRDLDVHMADNPSLKGMLPETMERAYGNAVIAAAAETNLPEEGFPAECPWSFDQIMDAQFWPEG